MKIKTYKLSIPGEIEVTFLNYGGIIQKLLVPDKEGKMIDVVLGFDDPEDYRKEHPYFGALIGRYANRIARGRFTLNGKSFELATNNGPNSLHGGFIGFDRVFWEVQKNADGRSCTLRHTSPAGHEGYPGNLEVEVTYTIDKGRELVIDYKAITDEPTVINLTNHSYFNLTGDAQSILSHELWLNADRYTEVDDDLTPTGRVLTVTSDMDFRSHRKIAYGGYDHNFVLNDAPLRDPKARLLDPNSGLMMEVFTTEPGIQFYSGNFLDGTLVGKGNRNYEKHAGLCLETQHFPDSPNHDEFPTTTLNPGEEFISKTIYKFSS